MALKNLAPVPKFQFFSNGGTPLAGGKLFTYTAGTATKATTWTDQAGGTPNTNPIVLDASGRCDIRLTTGLSYKFVLSPSTDTDPPTNAIWTSDTIPGSAIATAYFAPATKSIAYTTVAADHQVPIEVTGTTTITLGDASTMTAGYQVPIVNTGAALVTVNLLTSSNTLNGVANGSITLPPWTSMLFAVNNAANGYEILYKSSPYAQGASVVSAATLNLDIPDGDYVHITGSTGPITAITLQKGSERSVVFDGTPQINNGASLILPSGANITAAAGDTAKFRGEAAGVVRCISFDRASGSPVLDGVFRSVQIFSASGTYTAPAGLKRAVIEVQGAGGGSGGSGASAAGQWTVGAGGATGGYAIKTVAAATIGASQTVTIGAAGTAGSAAGGTGGTGGTSSFGAIVSATGGAGGVGSSTAALQAISGPAGGAGASGDVNVTGAPGGSAFASNTAGFAVSGAGGSSRFGGGGIAPAGTGGAVASAGTGFGSGGGGGYQAPSSGGTAGAVGAAGLVIVWEYY